MDILGKEEVSSTTVRQSRHVPRVAPPAPAIPRSILHKPHHLSFFPLTIPYHLYLSIDKYVYPYINTFKAKKPDGERQYKLPQQWKRPSTVIRSCVCD
jgi:hypothetical protein